jgi:ParB family chromosome partitioning protein
VRETERAIRRVIGGSTPSVAVAPAVKQNDANIKAAENKLRRKLGTQVRVMPSAKGNGGKLEIEYYNEGDLDRFYRLLMAGSEAV